MTSPRLSHSSRPESVIDKLRIESSDDGAGVGITIGGLFISANCSIILIIMAFIFILIGCVLTAISYRPREFGEDLERFLSRQEWGGHLKIIGPVILVIGFLMMVLGITFCILGYKVTKSEEKRFYADSISSATMDSPFMPTISQALLRNPTFPLIVPKAKWTTPQVNYSIAKNNQNQMQNTNVKTVIPRPRSSSLMVPFMGGVIVPSHEIDNHVKQRLKMRRNTLPANHTTSESRSRIAFVINEVKKASIKPRTSNNKAESTNESGSVLSRLKGHLSKSTTAPPLHSENSTISTSVSKYYKCPEEALTPVMQRTIPISDIPVIKDIACFPDPTWTEVNANMHCTPSIMEQVVR